MARARVTWAHGARLGPILTPLAPVGPRPQFGLRTGIQADRPGPGSPGIAAAAVAGSRALTRNSGFSLQFEALNFRVPG